MVRELMAEGRTEAEVVEIYVKNLGMSEIDARFVVDIELGRINGDVIADEDEMTDGDIPGSAFEGIE